MSDALKKLQHELEATQRGLTEAKARCANHDLESRTSNKELADARQKIELAHQEWIAALDVMDDPIFLYDKDCRILRCNRAYQQCAGIPFKKIIGQVYYDIFPKASPPLCSCSNRENNEDEEIPIGSKTYRSRAFSVTDKNGNLLYTIHTLADITERKTAETELFRLNRVLKTLSECNHTMLRAESESELMQSMCEAIIASGGYSLAWIGMVHQDGNKSVEIVAIAGNGREYVEALSLTWDDCPKGNGPVGSAARTGKTQIVHDAQSDPRFKPWREAAKKYGYAAIIALPLKEKSRVFATLNIYSTSTMAFNDDEVALLEEVADDLTFGTVAVRAEAQQAQTSLRLRSSLEGTISSMAAMVETRDPYTSGHQHRVAALAREIAQQMKLPEEDVHGIYLAAVIHDLGKVGIPAEILSKPGKLSKLEFEIIQTHAKAGYDILKRIDFPWPIAQMVYQHHERPDGSGYPNGLKNEDILIGAKIISVADTVEAMSSHRPYRPGLGMEAALNEIEQHSGKRYDAAVVNTCLRLFRENDYQLPV